MSCDVIRCHVVWYDVVLCCVVLWFGNWRLNCTHKCAPSNAPPLIPGNVPQPRILMVCADNYGALVNDPSQHPAYVPFVVMVIVVGSVFLLSLLLGVTYDVFIAHTTEQVWCCCGTWWVRRVFVVVFVVAVVGKRRVFFLLFFVCLLDTISWSGILLCFYCIVFVLRCVALYYCIVPLFLRAMYLFSQGGCTSFLKGM